MTPVESRVLAVERRLAWVDLQIDLIWQAIRRLQQAIREIGFGFGTGGNSSDDQPPGLAVVTVAVGPGSTAGPGTGTGTVLTTNGTTYTNTGVSVALYNSNTKQVGVGDVVQWDVNNGLRFVVVPGNCGDLS